jgi:DinB superfamily/Pentapeptide repeats (8 copies)
MPEEFEFQDLTDAVFWGVDLQRAKFRDVDLMGARISHARLVDVVVDGEIDRLVINGVDVTAYVNERDEWFGLRSQLHPTEAAAMRQGWEAFVAAWGSAIERAQHLPDAQRHVRVDGEWSFVETVRHLVFATDKWFTVPILDGEFHPLGIPNSGSVDFGWPGLDVSADPTFEDAVSAWRDRARQLHDYLHDVGPAALQIEVAVLENGPHAVHDCVGVVFEEHFHHLRYATRDLDRLGETS